MSLLLPRSLEPRSAFWRPFQTIHRQCLPFPQGFHHPKRETKHQWWRHYLISKVNKRKVQLACNKSIEHVLFTHPFSILEVRNVSGKKILTVHMCATLPTCHQKNSGGSAFTSGCLFETTTHLEALMLALFR